MPNPLTVASLKKLLKRKHRGRAKGIMARIEEEQERAYRAERLADDAQHDADVCANGLSDISDILDRVRAGSGNPEPPTEHPEEYLPNDIHVPSPGTSGVLSWPVVVDVEMTATLDAKGDIELLWDTTLHWQAEERADIGPSMYFGNSGMIYHSDTGWHAIATEWMRIGSEETGTYYPLAQKFSEGPPTPGMPIGKFVAGLWRHTADRPWYHRRTNVSWFDPKTWKRIAVPDFTVPADPEPFIYTMTVEDYKKVNDLAFLADVKLVGEGSGNILLPNQFRSKRWATPSSMGSKQTGTIVRDGDVLRMTWWPLWGGTVPKGHYGNLHMIYPGGYGYVSAVVAELWRPGDNTGLHVFVGSLPYSGPGLCGFVLSTVGDHPHQRRTDVHPWRFEE